MEYTSHAKDVYLTGRVDSAFSGDPPTLAPPSREACSSP